jgi:tetratricopeptide (TPR) repeat protein/DNA-binding XRE family transcriptional regulator
LVAEPPVVTFAALLRRHRTQAALSQEELAEASGLSTRAVSDLERGVAQTARKETARLLADALCLAGADRDWFEAVARGRAGAGAGAASGATIGGAAAAPRALPRDIGSFTGRAAELGELVGAVAAAGAGGVVGIHAIGGMAGIGKTALAVHAAHQLAPMFPDGQIFLPLHGHTPGQRPVEPADALASLLQVAGVGAGQIPAGLEARTALWRDRVAGRQLLLLLDDASGSEQVRPLLPASSGSLVLVTSRRHLTALEDAQTVSLDTLPEREAAQLLVRLTGRPGLHPADPAVAEITRLCGCLPLAVGMLARQLHHHPTWTAAELAADLALARDRLDLLHAENLSVAAAFGLSYAELADDQQRLFRRLGLHPGADIDAYAAAALDATSLAGARRNLEALYDHYLIGEPARGRYRFHDLIREHARVLAATDELAERRAATGRLLDYYQHTVTLTRDVLARQSRMPTAAEVTVPSAEVPEIADRAGALAWARAERANLQACLDQAARTGQLRRVVAYTAALATVLWLDGPWSEAVAGHARAADAASRLGDRLARAGALHNQGWVQVMTSGPAAALLTLEEALGIYRDLGDQPGQANTLSDIGRVQWVTCDYPAASRALGEALGIYRDLGDRPGEADALVDVGLVRLLTDDFPGGTAALADALRVFQDLGDRPGEARALSQLGYARLRTGDYPAAARAANQALALYHDLGDRLGQANAVLYLGTGRRLTGDYPGADRALEEALARYGELGDRRGRGMALQELGALRRATGDYPGAAQALEQALAIFEDVGELLGQADVLNETGTLHLARGDPDHALACHRKALDLARQIGSPWDEACALAGLGRTDFAVGRTADARASLTQALEIFQHIGAAEAPGIAAELRVVTSAGQAGQPPTS